MPTRSRNQPAKPHRNPQLTTSPDEAIRLLEERIRFGRELSQSFGPPGTLMLVASVGCATIDHQRNLASNWSNYNVTLLRKLFDTAEVGDAYSFVIGAWVSKYETLTEQLRKVRDRVDDHVSDLEGIVEKIRGGLYDTVPTSAPVALATDEPPSEGSGPAVYNIGTLGMLNTGEVRGNLDARVTAVNMTSETEYKTAIVELRNALAELPADTRADVLQVLDDAENVENQPPEKRRLGVLRTAVAALPDLLSVSARAMEAWDKYGPIIRNHIKL